MYTIEIDRKNATNKKLLVGSDDIKMETRRVSIEELQKNSSLWNEIGDLLRNGKLVAFPTETVYGLGANGLDSEAANKIYQAKGRPSDNPLILHVSSIEMVSQIAENIGENAYQLMKYFWPGPLTIVLQKKEIVPYGTTGGLDTVAVRFPSHIVAKKLIQCAGIPIAAPSANLSGRPSPTKAEHVLQDLDGKIDCVIDGGSVGIGIESTIIDMTSDVPMILRPGYITKEMIEEVLQTKVVIDPAILQKDGMKGVRPKAPGMKYKHYAPKGELTIVLGTEMEKVADTIMQLANEKTDLGYRVGIIATEETANRYTNGIVKVIGARTNPITISSNLYGILREFDEEEVEFIYSEGMEQEDLGQAIMNRLLKAAGYQVIQI